MATSSVPTLKANLVTQLQARGGLSGVQVTNGPPVPAPSREFIWVGDTDGFQDFAAFGAPNQRKEDYAVKVVIHVLKEGVDSVAADTRCFALSAELENQLRSDPTVNGAVNVAEVTRFHLHEDVSADGMNRSAELTLEVNCQQWI